MSRQSHTIFLISIFLSPTEISAATERTYNVFFIQPYVSETPQHGSLVEGLKKGFSKPGLRANMVAEFPDANFWTHRSEKLIARRFCRRARERETDLVVTVSDETFHILLTCGDSLPLQLSVAFPNIKYPKGNLIDSSPSVCEYTANSDFGELLRQVNHLFSSQTEVVCIFDNGLLSFKGRDDSMNEWNDFVREHPEYTVTFYNSQMDTANKVVASTCYPCNTYRTLIIAPKRLPSMSSIGCNSKAPFFSYENPALANGAFGAYDADSYTSAREIERVASNMLHGETPSKVGIIESLLNFMYDFKQLMFFKVSPKQVQAIGGAIIDEPYGERYRLLYILLYNSILALLAFLIVWLYRINHHESRRCTHTQTRSLMQNRLVAQRDEFDDVFYSIRDSMITRDADLRIHFMGRSLLKMLHLPKDEAACPYEGLPVGSAFKIYNNGKEILRSTLERVVTEENSVVAPGNSFIQEVHSSSCFPVSGEIIPIRAHGKIIGVALSVHNTSDEEVRKRSLSMAMNKSSTYPWQYNTHTGLFIFPADSLIRFGFAENKTTISWNEMDRMIHPDDQELAFELFSRALVGLSQGTRMNFHQLSGDGRYRWWEYRTSVLVGLTIGTPYSILGVCQNIQRYKTTEEQLTAAHSKAFQADELKPVFLANTNHETCIPLNVIVDFSSLLSDTGGFTEEEVKLFTKTINKNYGLLLTLIDDIPDLSHIESGTMDFQLAEHNPPLLMKGVYDSQQLNMPSGVRLVLKLPENSKKYLVTNNIRLQQMVNSLINNVTKFITQGLITLGYTEEEPRYTSIFVEDAGKGTSEDGLGRTFERLYKIGSLTQGAGLGLSVY